jgi:hypothetical protein
MDIKPVGCKSFYSQLGLSLTKMYWLLGRKSKLSINNKLLIYKVILKPTWTYGIQLWGTTTNSNIETLERFQSKVLRLTVFFLNPSLFAICIKYNNTMSKCCGLWTVTGEKRAQ